MMVVSPALWQLRSVSPRWELPGVFVCCACVGLCCAAHFVRVDLFRQPRAPPLPCPRCRPPSNLHSAPAAPGASRRWSLVARGSRPASLVRPPPAVSLAVSHTKIVFMLLAGGRLLGLFATSRHSSRGYLAPEPGPTVASEASQSLAREPLPGRAREMILGECVHIA